MNASPILKNVRRHPGLSLASAILIAALASTHAAAADHASLSETLELGIYTEETKGDINGAIELYRAVLEQSSSDRAVAAQAQFRLALCFDKQKDFAAATQAFEALIRDYPEEKELVALAQEYLADGTALLPAPWVDGEELTVEIKFAAGVKIGAGRYRAHAGRVGETDAWHLQSHLFAGQQTWSRTDVEAQTFRPLHSHWKSGMLGVAETEFAPGSASLRLKGQSEPRKVELRGTVYDNEEVIHLMRRLPLAEGYTTRLSVFAGLAGGAVVPVELHVTARESATVAAGTFDCFKVLLDVGGVNKQTFWYSADAHRYLVKFEAMGVIAELARIGTFAPGEPARFKDTLHGFAIEMPANWYLLPHPQNDDAKATMLLALDPLAIGFSVIKVKAIADLDPAAQASPRAYADHQIEQGRKSAPQFNLRADSWSEATIDGEPGVSYVADVHTGPTGMQVLTSVCAFVDGRAVEITCVAPTDEFASYRAVFSTVVGAYRRR